MKQPTIKPTVVFPDTAPLIHLAAGDALTVLNGMGRVVAVATTRNMLRMAEEEGIIPDAEALWDRITAAIPTANPASNLTLINPVTRP